MEKKPSPHQRLFATTNYPDKHADGVYQTLQGVAHSSEGLWQWYQTIMPRNLEHFGLEGDVPLRVYMDAVAAEAPALNSRLKAFDGLCQMFQPGNLG